MTSGSGPETLTGKTDLSKVKSEQGIRIYSLKNDPENPEFLSYWDCGVPHSIGVHRFMLKLADNKRAIVTGICGVIGIVLSLGGIVNYFIGFLSLLSYFITPICAILIADYWIMRSRDRASVTSNIASS